MSVCHASITSRIQVEDDFFVVISTKAEGRAERVPQRIISRLGSQTRSAAESPPRKSGREGEHTKFAARCLDCVALDMTYRE
jgi:hypothetical protein